MSKKLLFWKFNALRVHANYMNIYFPKTLESLTKKKPSKLEISNDFKILSKYEKHPAILNFIPTYEESRNDPIKSWVIRYNSYYKYVNKN